jgi:hypothetical protein
VCGPFLTATRNGVSSTLVAILTFYLVATSWVSIRRKAPGVGIFEIGAFLVALSVAVVLVTLGLQAANRPAGSLADAPLPAYFVFAAIATLAAATDLRMILRGGVSGTQRITRHLWRMCVALLIAAFSFFLGQQQIFPVSVRGSPILFLPEIAVLGSLMFWLVRVQFTNWYAADRAAPVQRSQNFNQTQRLAESVRH